MVNDRRSGRDGAGKVEMEVVDGLMSACAREILRTKYSVRSTARASGNYLAECLLPMTEIKSIRFPAICAKFVMNELPPRTTRDCNICVTSVTRYLKYM